MALGWVGDSNPIAGTTSATADGAAFDTAPVAGDHVLLVVVNKRDTATPPTPDGWERRWTGTVGSGAYGTNAGPMRITIFYQRIPSGGLVVPASTISGSDATTISAALIAVRTGSSETLETTFTAGSDATSDTAFSVTGGAVLPAKAGELLLAIGALTGNSPNLSSPTLTADGATTGTVNNPYSSSNSSGERLRSFAYRTSVTAGPATAAPVFTATLSAATLGGVLFARLRAVAANVEPTTPGTATPGSVLNIGQGAGKNHFSVDVATSSSNRELHETSEIASGYRNEPGFTTPTDNSAAYFWVGANYATTPGSENPRVELRETVPGSDANFAFDPKPGRGSGFHWIRGQSAAMYAPAQKPEIVLNQLHSGSQSDMFVTRLDLVSGVMKLVARVAGSSAGIPRMIEDYAFGTFFDWKIEVDVDRGKGRYYFNDMIHPWYVWDLSVMADTGTSYFFKAGDYLQANPSTITDAANEHGSVLLRNLQHCHPGWAAPENYVGWPDVDVGADAAMYLGQTLARTATTSPNSGGAINSREWYLVDGPSGVTPATLGSAAALSWTPNAAGIYVLRHGATNAKGTNTDDMVVTVLPTPTGPEPGRALLSHGVI